MKWSCSVYSVPDRFVAMLADRSLGCPRRRDLASGEVTLPPESAFFFQVLISQSRLALRAALSVADDQGATVVVALVAVRLQILGALSLQRRHEHPARPLAGDLIEQEAPVHLVLRRLGAAGLSL